MFIAGERPTGSRDPLGLRRQAQGAVKILVDLPELLALDAHPTVGRLLARAAEPFSGFGENKGPLFAFMSDRLAYLLEERGYDVRNVRAVMHAGIEHISPLEARRKLEALAGMSAGGATHASPLHGVASLFKRVKNITKGVKATLDRTTVQARLVEPAERVLWSEIETCAPSIRDAAARGDYQGAFKSIAALQPAVATFFDDVLVMAEDEELRQARLALVATLRDLILEIADISEIVTEA